jgi:hypothetical protein
MQITSRKAWGARRPRPRDRHSSWREFILHWPGEGKFSHIDSVAEEKAQMREFQNFHMDTRGWSDFAYGFAVFSSGRVYRGRGMDYVPAAQLGHNTGTVPVLCVIGPGEQMTKAMEESLVDLKNHCDKRAGRDLVVLPHSAVTSTSCPGPVVRAFVDDLNRKA